MVAGLRGHVQERGGDEVGTQGRQAAVCCRQCLGPGSPIGRANPRASRNTITRCASTSADGSASVATRACAKAVFDLLERVHAIHG